jgi:hypothetical protein
VIRDNLRWPSTELFAFVIVSVVLYGTIGAGLVLYVKGKVGPRFWTIFAFSAVLFGWVAHFSPFTDQPPSVILRAYNDGPAGWIAVGVLAALLVVIGVAGVYAAYLWGAQSRRARPAVIAELKSN